MTMQCGPRIIRIQRHRILDFRAMKLPETKRPQPPGCRRFVILRLISEPGDAGEAKNRRSPSHTNPFATFTCRNASVAYQKLKISEATKARNRLDINHDPERIGARGFEPPASRTRTVRSSQAELRPDTRIYRQRRSICQPFSKDPNGSPEIRRVASQQEKFRRALS